MAVRKIRKRDGRIVKFDPSKITNAILKAFRATGAEDGRNAEKVKDHVVSAVEKRYRDSLPTVEGVQDIVEEMLIKHDFPKVAKAYILYRQKRAEKRETRRFFGAEQIDVSLNAARVLERRYLVRDREGRVAESPGGMFSRVAQSIAKVERKYDRKADTKRLAKEFYDLMSSLEFLPNSPTLMNAGTKSKLGQLSACFVLPVEDSVESIFSTLKHTALIHKTGGGTGFTFTRLRPEGDIVQSTKGIASGPVSFMRVYDVATDVMKQGGKRRGANMGILDADHPDIIRFITAKQEKDILNNFNISVGVTDRFMDAVKKGKKYSLVNPRTGKPVQEANAREVFGLITTVAWRTGDPGIIFLDQVNRKHPLKKLGRIESTNPCGEVPLLPYESCNLGSINLARYVQGKKIDYRRLRKTVRTVVHFLDNVIDANDYPMKEIREMTTANRKIGLGVMGFAEMLLMLEIPYDSERALKTAERVMRTISGEARKKSAELGRKKGNFPNFRKSEWAKKYRNMRNGTVTTIAPTGTISIIANCSSGIEPLFAISFIRNVMGGTELLEVNSVFERKAKERGFYSKSLMMKIARKGSVQGMKEVPKDIRKVFVTALDISPEWHVRMQAVFQRYTDNAVSKTINFSEDASVGDVKKAYTLAHRLKCKGITVYRYGSKEGQVLSIGTKGRRGEGYVSAGSEYAGGCPEPYCPH